MNNRHLKEAVSGKLSQESIKEITQELADYARGGDAPVIPSASAYQRKMRDDTVLMLYEFLYPISHAEFYRLYCEAIKRPDPNDVIMMLFHQIHLMNNRFNLPVTSESTIKRACNNRSKIQ